MNKEDFKKEVINKIPYSDFIKDNFDKMGAREKCAMNSIMNELFDNCFEKNVYIGKFKASRNFFTATTNKELAISKDSICDVWEDPEDVDQVKVVSRDSETQEEFYTSKNFFKDFFDKVV